MDYLELKLAVEPYLEKLNSMKTSEEIRQFMVDEGILARRGDPHSCAIAEYVYRGSGRVVSVGSHAVCPVGEPVYTFGTRLEENFLSWHTTAMTEFVANFDAGDYPELVG